MDITLIRTFLEVVATGNFAAAAERVFVSQSAVSLRIKSLEEHLGRRVFLRSKTGVTLTPAGEQFMRYARTFLQIWEEAKQQVAVPEGYKDVLVIAGEYGLWNRFLIRALPLMEKKMPEVAFRAEVARPDRLARQMSEGTVDLSVLYTPQLRPGIEVEFLFDDKLIMVSSSEETKEIDENYVYVDWGEEFSAHHATNFPDYRHPRMTFDIGPATINYIINTGGSAYMPERLVEPFITDSKLFKVPKAPSFAFPVHAAWRVQTNNELLEQALKCIKSTIKKVLSGNLPPPFWV